ncbi:MAG: methyltransferase domain-containing protein [Acidobacteriota bacterium]|nr:methyltransferase domain-containing protein [Acidobacteriota bacterium]
MTEKDQRGSDQNELQMDSFRVGRETDLADWRGVWEADRTLPITSHRGWLGKPIVWLKRLLRGVVQRPQADLWERQRAYNLKVQGELELATEAAQSRGRAIEDLAGALVRVESGLERLGKDLQTVQAELTRDLRLQREAEEQEHDEMVNALRSELYELRDNHLEFLDSHARRLDHVEGFDKDGYADAMDHTTALFSRVEQKLDRYRELSRERWSRLGALLEVARSRGPEELARAVDDETYVEFEGLFRGREEDIGRRLAPYLEILENRGEVLDLGCGRGEALEFLTANGIECSGVDANVEMVARCREKGLAAEVSDLFAALAERAEASLGGVVSYHVIEHLVPADVDRLVRLAWRVLRPGGVLVLESPSPLSLVVGASNFWLDPTHRRPVHPDSLKAMFEIAGFDPVERIDLQPFPEDARLPEIAIGELAPDLRPLADGVNRLRDRLDGLLFGFQDFGMVGTKPS